MLSSPFPGMDPYLEGDLWPDVHQALANQIRRQLTPLIQPRYVARLGRYVVEDTHPESELGIMYPDAGVFLGQSGTQEPVAVYSGSGVPAPPAFSVPVLTPVEVEIPVVEIRDVKDNQLITAIEILSPVNKRAPGLEPYLQKRMRLHQSGVHLLEIDLLRRGIRAVKDTRLQGVPYFIALTRAGLTRTDIWPVQLQSRLPVIPVPLAAPDDDVALDLQQALDTMYAEAAYHLSIKYKEEPPPPALPEADWTWAKSLIRAEK